MSDIDSKKADKAKKKGSPLTLQLTLGPKDASRLHSLHLDATITFDDMSIPKGVLIKAALIALQEMEPSKRADIVARVIAESGR
ncbi:hypothetical protein [Aeromonas simiae]|uniref:Uncharacterized protein n=1 Tax=Aeromonas simiae TaxID=218936 RepID=A0A5J6X082_9GAMM|nr:hypothetical protein [Aeromonas simiae]MDO2948282.1 hypothetical protein [Aeromonas simiae]MDO2952981.1 hypothetical protein [Aeromonas simiae]MDO2955665.1 hypothetical protein [Aeromonas simiae]QFI55954.1 hypothetical protein FE240_15420 [Aeromonas simiae]